MKKSNLKKRSFILIPVLLLIPCIMIVKSVSSSSSRIILKDQMKINKIILHDAKGDHACDCFPPTISGWQIKNVTDTSASFRWVCSSKSSYQVNYGLTSSKGIKYPATKPTVLYTDYTVTVTGLKPNTTYHAGPVSKDPNYTGAGGEKTWLMQSRTQNDFPFTTKAKTAVLQHNDNGLQSSIITISEVNASKITTRDATITWKTNIPSTSEVEYGTTKNYGLKSGENTELARDHYIQLFDLTPGTTYYFRTVSKTGLGKTSSFSSDFSITTLLIEKRIADKIHYFTEPNPCADRVEFHYYLYQQINNLTIDILTLSGRKVAVLESPSSALVTGWNRISWNVKDRSGAPLVNGLYVYVMKFVKGGTEEILERSQFMVRR